MGLSTFKSSFIPKDGAIRDVSNDEHERSHVYALAPGLTGYGLVTTELSESLIPALRRQHQRQPRQRRAHREWTRCKGRLLLLQETR